MASALGGHRGDGVIMFGPRASRPLVIHEAGGTPAVRIMKSAPGA
jgi:hypothetical protein